MNAGLPRSAALGTGFFRPSRPEDAIEALALRSSQAIAGCTLLTPRLLAERTDVRLAVDLTAIEGFSEISTDGDGGIRLGATATAAAIAADATVATASPLLARVAGEVGDEVIRSVATVGGALAAADHAGTDLPVALLALGAQVRVLSAGGERTVAVDELKVERSELIVDVTVNAPPAETSWAWRRQTTNMQSYGVASAAVQVNDGQVAIAVGGATAAPRRLAAVEAAYANGAAPDDVISKAWRELESLEFADDGVTTPRYRRLAARRAFEVCLREADAQ